MGRRALRVTRPTPRSNYRLGARALLDRLSRAPRAVHRIGASWAPRRAASLYHDELDGVRLGLAFQGIGPDGHTASLFPNAPALEERERRAVAGAPRDDVDRVIDDAAGALRAETVLFLALGESKADAVRQAFAEPPGPETPASHVRSERGRTLALPRSGRRSPAAFIDNDRSDSFIKREKWTRRRPRPSHLKFSPSTARSRSRLWDIRSACACSSCWARPARSSPTASSPAAWTSIRAICTSTCACSCEPG